MSRCIADALPIVGERLACPFATADCKPISKDRGIHRPGAGCTETLERNMFLVQESVEYTPGKGPMRSASLKRQVDRPDLVGECRVVIGSSRRVGSTRRVPVRSSFHSRILDPTSRRYASLRRVINRSATRTAPRAEFTARRHLSPTAQGHVDPRSGRRPLSRPGQRTRWRFG